MLEPAVIDFRLLQFAGAMILCGTSLFLLYALPPSGPGSAADLRWPRPLLVSAAALILASSLAGLLAQTSILAGSVREGMTLESLSAVMTTMAMGPSTLVRGVASALAVAILLLVRPGRVGWGACTVLGAVTCASFAWMGHGAATPGGAGLVHLAADILHTLAAAVWIGALVAFVLLLRRGSRPGPPDRVPYDALHGFSGVGSALVAVLVATGLVNSWYLVGPTRIAGLWTTPYGQLLSLKLVLFAAMLGLAAANRFRLTPALGASLAATADSASALRRLRRSLAVETVLSLLVLALVAWLGRLAPVAAQ